MARLTEKQRKVLQMVLKDIEDVQRDVQRAKLVRAINRLSGFIVYSGQHAGLDTNAHEEVAKCD